MYEKVFLEYRHANIDVPCARCSSLKKKTSTIFFFHMACKSTDDEGVQLQSEKDKIWCGILPEPAKSIYLDGLDFI